MLLPINEVFATVQGEAYWTGAPSTFIRLQGCDVGCPWCDTKHTWVRRPGHEIAFDDMVLKVSDAPTYALADVEQLVGACTRDHIVITGGEPCDHNLRELTGALLGEGHSVQIETSGTSEVRVNDGTWVTVSPKVSMPGGKAVLGSALARADEIKMPVGKRADLLNLTALLGTLPPGHKPLVWLQPLSQSPKATALCVAAAAELHCRVSIQVHKYLGVR